MNPTTIQQLVTLNQQFYQTVTDSFAESRATPQPGFYQLLEHIPTPCPRFLDVGCGEGRLGRFMQAHHKIGDYVGVDFSEGLLAHARQTTPGRFHTRNLTQPNCLAGLGQFQAIACLSTLQHLPGRDTRLALLHQIKQHLTPNGHILLGNWQFLDSPRQQRKITDWSAVGLTPSQLDPHDYLLTWKRTQFSLRYVNHINLAETQALAQETGLTLHTHFRNDGKEGNLNLYTILKHNGE